MALGVWLLVVVSVVSQLPLCPVQAPPRGRHSRQTPMEGVPKAVQARPVCCYPLGKGLVSGFCSAPESAVAPMTYLSRPFSSVAVPVK